MTDIEKLKTTVIYHRDCVDGIAAAAVYALYVSTIKLDDPIDTINWIPLTYGMNIDDALVVDRDVVLLDFSFKRPKMFDILKKCKSLLVIDHHKSAQEDLDGLVDEYLNLGELNTPQVSIIFNMNMCGSLLAYSTLINSDSTKIPYILNLIDDTDRGVRAIENSNLVGYWIRTGDLSDPQTIINLADYIGGKCSTDIADIFKQGFAIKEYNNRSAEQVMAAGRYISKLEVPGIGTFEVPCINCNRAFTAAIAFNPNMMADVYEFCVMWSYYNGMFVYELRRRNDSNIDLSKIAVAFGGGGHVGAAGFHSDKMLLNKI